MALVAGQQHVAASRASPNSGQSVRRRLCVCVVRENDGEHRDGASSWGKK